MGGGESLAGFERGLTLEEPKYSIKAPGTGAKVYKWVGNRGGIRGVLL